MAKKKPRSEPDPQAIPDTLKFDYIKGNFFRVVHADGAWGGITPRHGIVMSFWSERPPIPKQMVYQLAPDGTLGEEIRTERVTRQAIVREVEVSVIMDLPTAKSFLAWLQAKVEAAQENLESTQEGGKA